MSLKNKLNRLKPHLSPQKEQEALLPSVGKPNMPQLPENNNISSKVEIPYLDRWESEGVTPYFFDGDYCLIREVRYPMEHFHGHYRFKDLFSAVEAWNHAPSVHPLSAYGHKAEDLFFFDTETTGLGGGTGNTIFLLGYARVDGDELVLRQHILPNPGAEVPLYQSFLEKVDYKTLVTYNGKSFDWPQVKTRHTLIREHVPKLPSFGHFDLYHASRRLWKHKLERMKLSIVEKEVLGVERIDDIPGFLAPMIYFDFIESKLPEGMLGILKHNEIDILSLVSLYTHLTFQLCSLDQNQTREESFEVGRWFASLGEKAEAEKLFDTLAEGTDDTSLQAKQALAFSKKKERNWKRALELFVETAESGSSYLCMEACIEAAKIYEHKEKKINKAIEYTSKALEIYESKKSDNQDFYSDVLKRRDRLDRKSKKIRG